MKIQNVLHKHDFEGDYGITGTSKLVVTDTGTYWVKDYYCGENSLPGGTLRPFVCKLPEKAVAALEAVWDAEAGEYSQDLMQSHFTNPIYCSVEEYLVHIHAVQLDSFRASSQPWAAALVEA